MDEREYNGQIKYLGKTSYNQHFKSGAVTLHVENERLLLKTRLRCNPGREYRSNEISGAEVFVKGQRMVLKCKSTSSEFWELHFMGDSKQKLCEDIKYRLSKVSSKIPNQNKAEVGRGTGRKSDMSPNDMLRQVSPQSDQSVKKLPNNITPSPTADKDQLYLSVTPTGGFTRVKEPRQTGSDDESKENQHRGLVFQDVEKQNKQDRKPLQATSFRFYGSSTPDVIFTGTKPKMSSNESTPVAKPEMKKGQFSDFMTTYSWNHSRITPPTEAKKLTPQLQGFANIGNTCYMNAILQSLFSLETFSVDLQSLYKHHSKVLTRQSLAVVLTRLMAMRQRQQSNTAQKVEEMLHSVKRAISATARRFIGSQQHDAHEFLCQVLDQLKEEVIKVTKPREARETPADDSLGSATAGSTISPASVSTLCINGDQSPASIHKDQSRSPASLHNDQAQSPSLHNGGSSFKAGGALERVDRISPTTNQIVAATGGKIVNASNDKGSATVSEAAILVNPTFANFEFEVVHTFQCLNCQEQIQKAEQFNDLSVDIPSRSSGITLTLQDALDVFFQKEEIDYRCEKCGHLKAEVTHKFAKLPRVLILHLKRYTYNMRSNKMQERLQLPRFITLQDHCDSKTLPHLPHLLLHNSPLKSPMITSPVKTPVMASPDNFLKRRSFGSSENSEISTLRRSPKKVRRSLLAEVGACDDAVVPDSVETEKSRHCDEDLEITFQSSKQTEKPKTEVDSVEMEDYDEQLQKVLDISRQEYEASNNSKYWDHGYSTDTASLGHNNNTNNNTPGSLFNTKDECTDVSRLSEEEQIRLAICRSLESSSPSSHDVPDGPDSLLFGAPTLHQPATPPKLKEIPPSALSKENGQHHESQDVEEQTGNVNSISGAYEPRGLDLSAFGLKGFTKASDFMRDSSTSRTSPENANNGDLISTGQTFTSCKRPLTESQCDGNSRYEGSAAAHVSTHIGSVGALSNGVTMMEQSQHSPDHGGSSSSEDRRALVSTHSVFDAKQAKLSPPSYCNGKEQSPESPSHPLNTEQWTPDEEQRIFEAMEEDIADPHIVSTVQTSAEAFAQSSIPFSGTPEKKTVGSQNTEEKENMSPPGDKSRNTESPIDKEMEAKQLQHKLRQTEIEKGLFPHSYRLVSIVNHHGATSSFGHYVSDVFDIKKQTWFSIDDKHVEKTTESFVRTQRTSTGYIFFYLSKDIFDDIDNMRPCGMGKELSEIS